MLVKRITKFMEDLGSASLMKCDTEIHALFLARFAGRAEESMLTKDDIAFMVTQFKERWSLVCDTKGDYTLYPGGVNQLWVQLAKEFAPIVKETYLKILLPSIKNTVDFNNLTALTDSERPENLYVGYNQETLYRKRGLCEHLIAKHYVLSTRRSLSKNNELRALSIEELTRLKVCENPKGAFSIADEPFISFWDFLVKKVFSHLNKDNEPPLDFLPYLLLVIEQYYLLKDEELDFSLFKKALNTFLSFLYKMDLEQVNRFYGCQIQFKGKQYYLLELLIKINSASAFDIDEDLAIILAWMHQINPALYIVNKSLAPVYDSLQLLSPGEPKAGLITANHTLYDCKTMLLSLFVLDFDYLPLCEKSISILDKSNKVFSQAAHIYSLFEPLIAENKTAECAAMYRSVIKRYIAPHDADTGFFTLLTTSFDSTHRWYELVQSGSLTLLDVNWYEPELLMHALVRFRSPDLETHNKIDSFLNELIQTYNQKANELQKQLRVNILFAELLKALDLKDKRVLLMSLQLYFHHDVQSTFLANCTYHIGIHLTRLAVIRQDNGLNFFSGTRKMERVTFALAENGLTNIGEVVDSCKKHLHLLKRSIEPTLFEKLLDYLQNLGGHIVTCVEKRHAKDSVSVLDSIGAYT